MNIKKTICAILLLTLIVILAAPCANAAETYTLFFDLAGGSWPDGYVGGSEEGSFGDSIFLDFPDPVRDGYTFSGWNHYGAGEYDPIAGEFTFGDGNSTLVAGWVPIAYNTTVILDGASYSFTSSVSYPKVTVFVSPSGCTLTDGSTTQVWTYSGSGQFLGLGLDSIGEADFPVGEEFYRTGSASSDTFEFYSISSVVYSTVVSINGIGFSFYGSNASPDVTITITDTGCLLTDGESDRSYSYSGSGDFTGLSLSQGAEPSLFVGDSFVCEGKIGADQSYDFYSADEDDKVYQTGVLGWFQRLFDSIVELPQKIIGGIVGPLAGLLQRLFDSIVELPQKIIDGIVDPNITGLRNLFDFSAIKEHFVSAWNNVRTCFGLLDFIDGEHSPFSWLEG